MSRPLSILLAGGFFAFILAVIFYANTGQRHVLSTWVAAIPYGDKAGHFLLFGLLTLLVNLALQGKKLQLGPWHIFLGSLAVLIFVICEELSQHFIASRTMDIKDLLADLLGIVLFSWLSTTSDAQQRAKRQTQ